MTTSFRSIVEHAHKLNHEPVTTQARQNLENCLPLVQLVPYMLLRVEFMRIGWQKYRAYILRQLDFLVSPTDKRNEPHQSCYTLVYGTG